jgi:hypothetical protein
LRGFWFKQRPFKYCGTSVNINEYLIDRPGDSPLTNDVREVRTKRGCPCPFRRRREIVIGILAEACCNFVSVSRIEGFDISPYDMLDTLSSAEFIRHEGAPTLLVRLQKCLREIGGADNTTILPIRLRRPLDDQTIHERVLPYVERSISDDKSLPPARSFGTEA